MMVREKNISASVNFNSELKQELNQEKMEYFVNRSHGLFLCWFASWKGLFVMNQLSKANLNTDWSKLSALGVYVFPISFCKKFNYFLYYQL